MSEVYGGRYRLEALLGRGGMGEVWKAYDTSLDRFVALKLMSGGADERARFEREARIAAGLSHPNIIPVHDVGTGADGRMYLAMALIDGTTLARERLTPREAARILREAALAVDHAHGAGVIHRDLKPTNLLLDKAGRVYVADFGLAKRADVKSSLSTSGTMIGTPAYMPPEQAMGRISETDAVSDVYSLGATLYETLTGSAPFEGETPLDVVMKVVSEDPVAPRRLKPSVPADLETIALKAMRKEPAERYPNAAAFAEDLRRWLDGEPISATPESGAARMARRVRKHPALVALATVSAVVILTAAVVIASLSTRQAGRGRAETHLEHAREALARLEEILKREGWKVEEAKLEVEAVGRHCEQALAASPRHEEAHRLRGDASALMHVHGSDDYYAPALAAYDAALKAKPDHEASRLGRLRLRLRRYHFLREPPMLDFEPDRVTVGEVPAETADAAALRGEIEADIAAAGPEAADFAAAFLAYASGRFADAVAPATRVIDARATRFPDMLWIRGLAHFYTGRYPQSEDDLTRSLLYGRSSTVLRDRGDTRLVMGRVDDAIADYTAAARISPSGYILAARGGAYYRRWQQFRRKADLDAALKDAIGAASVLKNAAFIANVSQLLIESGRPEQALEFADRLAREAPGDVRALSSQANALQACGRHEEALRVFDRLIDQYRRPMDRGARAVSLIFVGRWDDAERDLRALLEVRETLAPAHIDLGRVLGAKGRLDEAEKEFTRALQLDIENVDALRLRCQARMELKKHAAALADANEAIRIRDADGATRMRRAMLTFMLGYPRVNSDEEARELLNLVDPDVERALKLAPQDGFVLEHAGLHYFGTMRKAEAVKLWKRAQEVSPARREFLQQLIDQAEE